MKIWTVHSDDVDFALLPAVTEKLHNFVLTANT